MELIIGFILILALIGISNIVEMHKRWLPWLIGLWALLNGIMVLLGLILLLSSRTSELFPQSLTPPPLVGGLVIFFSSLSMLVSIPYSRRQLGKIIPIRADSPIHLTSLMLSIYLFAWGLINLAWLGGVEGLSSSAETVPISLYVVQAIGLLIVSMVGVGYGIRRNTSQIKQRLGIADFKWNHVLISAGAVIILLAVNFLVAIFWVLFDPDQVESISEISQIMLGNFDSLPAIFLLAVLSGVSEEILFRGALQPRFGIVWTSILFASTHIQYAISPATLIVLVIGFALGLLRRFFGTWTSILSHFGYNLCLLLMGWVAERALELMT